MLLDRVLIERVLIVIFSSALVVGCTEKTGDVDRRVKKMENVDQRVRKIVAEQLGISEAEVKNESACVADLGADSLDTVELVMALEDEFETEISDEDAEKITTVQQAIDYVNSHAKKKP